MSGVNYFFGPGDLIVAEQGRNSRRRANRRTDSIPRGRSLHWPDLRICTARPGVHGLIAERELPTPGVQALRDWSAVCSFALKSSLVFFVANRWKPGLQDGLNLLQQDRIR
jgi:hypothetical protein